MIIELIIHFGLSMIIAYAIIMLLSRILIDVHPIIWIFIIVVIFYFVFFDVVPFLMDIVGLEHISTNRAPIISLEK